MKLYQYFFPFLSGFLLTLSFPNSEVDWLAWIALVPLILSLDKINGKRAFKFGFVMGLSHFLSLLYWIVPTISTYGQLPLLLALPILILLSGYLALYPALFALGLSYLKVNSKLMPLTAAALWVSLEYIRSIFMSGFPWGLVGYSQYSHLELIQIADITSVYGISFIVVLTNAVIARILALKSKQNYKSEIAISIFSLFLIFGFLIGYGKFRITDIKNESDKGKILNISVVQGNIEQALKWEEAYQKSTIEKYCKLSIKAAQEFKLNFQNRGAKSDKLNLIIFPETALPFYYTWNKNLSNEINSCIKDVGTNFLIGSPSFKTIDKAAKIYQFYNRAYMVNELGVVIGSYDKVHLVPFGEYVPFGRYLSFLGKIIAQAGDFSAGKRDAQPLLFNLSSDSVKSNSVLSSSAGVLICFEVIFPYLARESVNNGAQLLVTMTNDAWFGYTSAPKQHFAMAIFRAVENRRAVARAANTGISGFIDPTGKVLQTSNLFEDAALTEPLPAMTIQTFYSKFGDAFAFVCIFFV
ncbi:MAG: apolipoprotein N-acyltransferase, partial [Desulfamplus sp.]|nr:apolipoprotein N-acyltransferase [Desulfamplus sp.]